MFILWALIEEQQRLIFMEKKIIKAGKGRGETGEGLVLVTDSQRLWQVGAWQCPPLCCGGGAQCQGGWGPLDFEPKAGEPPPGLPSPTEARVGLSQVHCAGVGVGVGPDSSHMFLSVCPLPSVSQSEFWKHQCKAFNNMSLAFLLSLFKIIHLIQWLSTCGPWPLGTE